MTCKICAEVNSGRPWRFTARIPLYGSSSMGVFNHFQNQKLGCLHGGLRPWFTGRKSLYGPSTRSYLAISSAGRKLKLDMPVYDVKFTDRIALYGPYFALYDHWAVLPTFNFSHFSTFHSNHPHPFTYISHETLYTRTPRTHH